MEEVNQNEGKGMNDVLRLYRGKGLEERKEGDVRRDLGRKGTRVKEGKRRKETRVNEGKGREWR